MSTIPTLEHTTFTINKYNRYNITTDNGWVLYDSFDYINHTDEEGNPCEPTPEEICYYRAIYNLPSDTDFKTRIVVVNENEVPAEQIFGTII